jgi:hypothetical protein
VQEVSAGRTLAAAALAGFIVTSGCQTGAQSATPARPTSTAAGLGMAGDVAELAASANRKLMHDDGKGCLADLARLAELDPRVEKTLVVVRAQCEMLLGRCQSGKQQIADYYVREMNMSEPRALIMAESIGSMRCRGGDMSDRDTLLRALYELSDGAYMNARPAADCLKNVRLVRGLAPQGAAAGSGRRPGARRASGAVSYRRRLSGASRRLRGRVEGLAGRLPSDQRWQPGAEAAPGSARGELSLEHRTLQRREAHLSGLE